MRKRMVIALGGNAIVGTDGTACSQKISIRKTMNALAKLIKKGHQLVITHGNGPQVGNLLLQMVNGCTSKNPVMPLDTIGAMTEGAIGYWMQQELNAVLHDAQVEKTAAAIVTQTLVSASDPAFKEPSKPIGPFYSKEEVTKQTGKHSEYLFKEDAGRGYRRVVPSPKPVTIIEYPVVKLMLENQMIPIAAGGGGIPVIEKNGQLKGIEGVIDKDFSAAKLAENISADELIILTSVDHVYLNFNKPEQKMLTKVSVQKLKQYIKEGQFAPGSMLPKIEATIDFVERTGKSALITSLKNVELLEDDPIGTVITR
ncbi:carbamate kinase [Liquorilactobacillus satsumensis]|uniref:carbamate kinase n=1 Tax=Liquorilactobacillus satsumensis TaxID=259059 RepID=UPI0021C2ACD5|nr:carbamate kinase [Liquorilactobacillus satsumensis]